jgi:regulator of protease activity HflC (stomatin/prohibitin superfamily)
MDNAPVSPPSDESLQLAQVRVPLERAGDAFETPDASGRTPIVVLPRRNLRVRVDLLSLAGAALAVMLVALLFDWSSAITALSVAAAGVLVVLACMSAFFLRVPEGTTALLVQGGRHKGTLGPGTHVVMPFIIVSHLVTRRQIPFDLRTFQATTRDNVSASVDGLLTIVIEDPVRFVYVIAAPDFDLVLQAACRDGLRSLLRQLNWSQVLDIGRDQVDFLRQQIEEHVESYGVKIGHLNITHASPHSDFLHSEEAKQLATVQRAQQAERHVLDQRRLQDEQQLEQMRVAASIDRDRERLQAQLHQAEIRRRTAEIDAETQEFRLSHLEDLLNRYPHAAEWEWQSEQLTVARALAGNNRSVLHLGRAADVVTTLWPDNTGEATAEAPHTNGPASSASQVIDSATDSGSS